MTHSQQPSSSKGCPKCRDKAPLQRRSVEADAVLGEVAVDVCRSCHGVWLDWGEVGDLHELQLWVDGITAQTAWQHDHQRGACPSCGPAQTLHRLPLGAFGVDRCAQCLGLWFDGGELSACLTEQGFGALLRTLGRVS